MEQTFFSAKEELYFKGRPGDPRLGDVVLRPKRWQDLDDIGSHYLVIYGCPDDTGIQLNKGRVGAKEAPAAIRKHFYKFADPVGWRVQVPLVDVGDVPPLGALQETHARVKHTAMQIAQRSCAAVALGGGHDFVFPNVAGLAEGSGKRVGLINVDPHLDVRELDNGYGHSGTGFRQLIENRFILGKDLVEFGAREGRNAASHFEYCKSEGVNVVSFETLATKPNIIASFEMQLAKLERRCDVVAVTFDMDACSDGDGVSAPCVIGFNAWMMTQFAYAAGRSPKVRLIELAEVSPPHDTAEKTQRIAAEMIFWFMKGQVELRNRVASSKKRS